MATKILLADDHKMMREGLRVLVAKQRGMEVVGEARDGQEAVRMARRLSPDVVVMDVAMPGLNGIEATRQITGSKNGPKVIGLSMHSDRRYVTEMLKAGASGYLVKDAAFEELNVAIHTVVKGQTYLSPSIASTVLDEYRRMSEENVSAFSLLTDRQREVLQQMAEGCSAKEIASNLSLSVKTIETHRQQIMEKTGCKSVAELTKYALREGLTDL